MTRRRGRDAAPGRRSAEPEATLAPERGRSGSRSAQRAGGIVVPLLTAIIAFFMGGLVVLATTGKNPLKTYRAIFNGAGPELVLPLGPRGTCDSTRGASTSSRR